jgi:hypothetical protein
MPTAAVPDDVAPLTVSGIDPLPHDDEALRPVVLGADTLHARRHQAQLDRTVLVATPVACAHRALPSLRLCVAFRHMVVRKASLPSVTMRAHDSAGCGNTCMFLSVGRLADRLYGEQRYRLLFLLLAPWA